MSLISQNVAIVSETTLVNPDELTAVAAALSKQATRDLAPAWGISAHVAAFTSKRSVPADYWLIRLQDGIDVQGAAGVHMDANGQPYSLVDVSQGAWSSIASHELCEMLVDPFGRRFQAARAPIGSPQNATGHLKDMRPVRYLVEACDPCERVSYTIDGIDVSDFLLPAYYHTVNRKGSHYCFSGEITKPRTLLAGGYVSYEDVDEGAWYQGFAPEGDPANGPLPGGDVDWQNVGPYDGSKYASLREFTDAKAEIYRGAL